MPSGGRVPPPTSLQHPPCASLGLRLRVARRPLRRPAGGRGLGAPPRSSQEGNPQRHPIPSIHGTQSRRATDDAVLRNTAGAQTDAKAQRGPGPARAKAGGTGDGEFGFYGLTLADAVGLGASAAGLAMALKVGAIPRGALQAIAGRDVAMAFVCFVGAVAWVKLFDVLTLKGVIHQTLSRKIVHITCGPVFVAFWPFFTDSVIAPYLASLVPIANMLRLGVIGTGIIRDEAAVRAVSREGNRLELLRGPFYYCIVLFFVTVVFWRANPVGAIVLATMCGGDGFADVVGRRFGASNKLPYNPSKSLAGSLAMFIGGMGLSVVLLGVLELGGCQTVDWPLTLRVTAATVAACTVLESLPINKVVDDNISVPILAAVMSSKLLGLGLLSA